MKYQIQKSDGTPVDPDAQYFILRIDTDEAARKAILTYADAIQEKNSKFADDIRTWVSLYA